MGDDFTVPLCAFHHDELHRSGSERTWWHNQGFHPEPIAADLWAQSRALLPAPDGNDSIVSTGDFSSGTVGEYSPAEKDEPPNEVAWPDAPSPAVGAPCFRAGSCESKKPLDSTGQSTAACRQLSRRAGDSRSRAAFHIAEMAQALRGLLWIARPTLF